MVSREYKLYRKAQKKYVKQMTKLLKRSGPWDWCFMWEALGMMVERRLAYFKNGYNVHQIDDSANEIVEELQTALNLWEEAENFEFTEDKERAQLIAEKGWRALIASVTKPTKRTEEEQQSIIDRHKKEFEEEQQAYTKFFVYVAEHFRKWWD